MKILKASAGSGKTYALSHTYIDTLLASKDPKAYRHILAVTFTNKATAEMKARILRDLDELSRKDPRAHDIMVDILHDYGAFSVTTIDKFFQQTLKAFSREIGQFADYQIELDRKSLIMEAMDRILDSLTEDKHDLVDWLKASLADKLEIGQKFSLDEGLYDIGSKLKSEEHRELQESLGIDDREAYSKTRLDAIRKECRKTIDSFEKQASALGVQVEHGTKIKKPGKTALKKSPEIAALFEKPFSEYCTAFILNELIFNLGLAGEFYKAFDDLLKEKNVMCLDESNALLRDIIDGSDAPFVYEKLGVRFENFLLDEFQDTSNIQWENFRPLLKESESKGGMNLVVGDVKQSIYRFRDSDWELLGTKIVSEFPSASVEPKCENWRSTETVVHFNNGFFTFAAEKLGLQDIYADVEQKVCRPDSQKGSVELTFTDEQLPAVLDSIRRAMAAGAQPGDIAVLVRNRPQGAEVAEYLMKNGISVVSDDSLNLKSSLVVRRLVSLLSFYENPEDSIGGYLARLLDVVFPDKYHSLVDFCESLLRSLRQHDQEAYDGEVLFIQAFMDEIQTWTATNGNNIHYFLRHWEESEKYIGSPDNSSSVRILTIHKSKGLEFPYLIFPYAEKVNLFKGGSHWCHLDTKGSSLNSVLDGIYPVDLSSFAEDTLFSSALEEERYRQLVDNINVFYVALTRAGQGLHVISKMPSKKCREAVQKGKGFDYVNFSEILYHYGGGMENRIYGEMYDFTRLERKVQSREKDFQAHYPSIALGARLAPSADAADFFGEDGNVGAAASARLNGIVLHDILSSVTCSSDLRSAVDAAVEDGKLSRAEGESAFAMLTERISAHPEWFADGLEVRNEMSIFDRNGFEHRPDRVVVMPESTFIIDFKFGKEDEKYLRQLARYISLYRQMGYPEVSGCLWYVNENKTIGL